MPRSIASIALAALALTACRSTKVPTFQEELAGTCWRLEKMAPDRLVEGVEITLCFDDPTRLSGSGGCNRYSASARFAGDTLEVSPVASTRMACEPAVMEQEQQYYARLQRARRWVVKEDELLLFADEPPALRFVRADGTR